MCYQGEDEVTHTQWLCFPLEVFVSTKDSLITAGESPKNRLAAETSPYLKQHEANPVDWYPWGEEALARARSEDKPILLSIGYSACHWCHVMAHESFENEATAAQMNADFINIKVDREERPDLDAIYMDAVQMISGHGGWPLTAFLTPGLKPFYGGTYFPPEARYGQPGFRDVLKSVSSYFKDKRSELETRAGRLIEAIGQSGTQFSLEALETSLTDAALSIDKIIEVMQPAYERLLAQLDGDADRVHGGFGRQPKFPQPSKIAAMLTAASDRHIAHAILTLNKIRVGGITDQIGGGVARYSVDNVWLVPHFEKMLYDNAQLLPLYAQAGAFLASRQSESAKDCALMAENIFGYLENDLKCSMTGLYFSAEDADSEGEEGKFYVFYEDELDEAFGTDVDLKDFSRRFFKITPAGNFEGANILTCPEDLDAFGKQCGLSLEAVRAQTLRARDRLNSVRATRVRPGLDTKILLGWNALAATGLLKASVLLGNPLFAKRGLENVSTLLTRFKLSSGQIAHTLQADQPKIAAFCDDVSFLFEACVEALLLTGCQSLVSDILALAKYIHTHFVDPTTGTLYFAAKDPELVVRPHKPDDNVVYSAHAALLGATQLLLTWVGGQRGKEGKVGDRGGESDRKSDSVLSPSDAKMLEALSLVAGANVAKMAQDMPSACAQSLLKARWAVQKNLVTVSKQEVQLQENLHAQQLENHQGDKSAKVVQPVTLSDLTSVWQSALARGKAFVAVGNTLNNRFVTGTLAQYANLSETSAGCQYTLCHRQGCHLPTNVLAEIFEVI